MSRRTSRPTRPNAAAAALDADAPCPCGRPATYAACCRRLHRGEAPAVTAEDLMRSRYSAFAVRDTHHLLRTWHPDTRPTRLELDPRTRWLRLEVLAGTEGGPFHTEGTVTFRAHYREAGHEHTLREHSRFVRHEGAWVYLGPLPPTADGPAPA